MTDRHVIVTGGGTGIGRAVALRLGRAGARLSLLGRNADRLRAAAQELGSACAISCDVQDGAAVEQAFDQACEAHGPIHALVANAGVGGANDAGDGDRWAELIATNLTGSYLCARAAQARLASGPAARHVVFMASILGRFGVPGYTGYCASKTGLIGLARALALELAGDNVLVNAVCPGWVDTDMAREGIEGMAAAMGVSYDEALRQAMAQVPLGRMSTPDEIAGAVAWLLSDDAATVTGQALDVNGGAFMG